MFIRGDTVTFTNCDIYQNTASGVSALARFGSSNAPMESLTDMIARLAPRLSPAQRVSARRLLNGILPLPMPRWNR